MRKALLAILVLLPALASAETKVHQEVVGSVTSTGGTTARALKDRFADVVNVKDYGATGDGVTDDTAAIQAAINAAAAERAKLLVPGGDYKTTAPLALSGDGHAAITIIGAGTAVHGSPIDWLNPATAGSRILCDHTGDCITSTSVDGQPSYRLEGLVIAGPDRSPAQTTTSGHGVTIAGTGTPRIVMRDVAITGFRGTGKAGLRVRNAEYSVFDSVTAVHNHIGFDFGSDPSSALAFNANTLINLFAMRNVYGMIVDASEAVTMTSPVIQSNEKTGLSMSYTLNWTVASAYLENNNSSATAGEHAIKLMGRTGGGSNQHLRFIATHFSTTRDTVLVDGSDVTGQSIDVKFDGVYANGVGSPAFTLGAQSKWVVLDEVHGTGTVVSDSGIENRTVSYGKWNALPLASVSQTRSDGTPFTFDARRYSHFECVFGGSGVSFSNPTGGVTGQEITIRFANQGGGVVGAVTWGSAFKVGAWGGDLAYTYDRSFRFQYDGTYWREVGRSGDVPH